MKFYLISDNVDTEMGLRLVGIEGEVVHKRRDFLEVLETKMKDRSIGVILITTKLIELAPDVISEIKLKQQKPLLVEIPDRHGNPKPWAIVPVIVATSPAANTLEFDIATNKHKTTAPAKPLIWTPNLLLALWADTFPVNTLINGNVNKTTANNGNKISNTVIINFLLEFNLP